MPASVPPPHFAIKGFRVAGDNPLGDSEAQRVLSPYVRNDATIETLQEAAAALEKALRDKGFGLHRVALPPQEVGETVRLDIVRFTIGKVEIEGRSIYSERNVRLVLPDLKEGETPNFSRMAVQTAMANENLNKQVQLGLRESEEIDKIDATITVKEQKPWSVGVGLSNAGNQNSGRDRFTVTASHSNLWDLDHQFIGAYTTSLERASDVKQVGLNYRIPLFSLGGVVAFSATKSDVVGTFGTFTSTGAGHTLGASYTHYLAPVGGRRSYITFGIDDKLFKATEIGGQVVGFDRRSVPITVGYSARVEADKSTWGYDINFAANTGLGSHDDLESYASPLGGEDVRIDTVHWKALRGSANYTTAFADTWLWSARGSWQYSPDVLISGEQFGLGGLGSVRGTEIDRPITADKGLQATFEITTPEFVQGLRAVGFVDAGWLWNNKPNTTTKLSSDHLASLGVGLRYVRDPFSVSFDYGRIVVGGRVAATANSAAPKKGDDRFYVSFQVRF
jgi:hemolysin activation/secretion protein